MKRMGREMGEEAGEGFEEEIDRAMVEAGENGEGGPNSGGEADDDF
jgi:hypothetical protein